MRPPADESAIETPLVMLILILVVVPLIFFGVQYEMKVRAETQAQAERETAYQSVLHSYRAILKPSVKRKEVEDYLRANKIEFERLFLDDLTHIGQDEPIVWFCGKTDVFLKFKFTAFAQPESQTDAKARDTLVEIEIFRMALSCL